MSSNIINLCKIDGCTNPRRYSNGLCPKHNQRLKKHGDPLWEPPKKEKYCKVDGCNRPRFSNGYCRSHDGQIRNHGKILETSKFKKIQKCIVDGCDGVSVAWGMCSKHYQNIKKYGEHESTRINKTELDEYEVWCGMISRCNYEKHKSYKYYGGRGVSVCERWINSFSTFYSDMGPRPSSKHQIDRIDNDKDYEPGNCEWVTSKINNSHKSNSVVSDKFIAQVRGLKEDGYKQKEIIDILCASRSSVQRAYTEIIKDKT
jgi:hypothetical protein